MTSFPAFLSGNHAIINEEEGETMRVKCSLCDKVDTIDSWSFEAKRLRNKPAKTYMCQECHARITERTAERAATGQFHLYPSFRQKRRW